jgi:drug/metabolite transporter (DMT)-like permease
MYLGEIAALITSFLWSGTSFAFASASRRIGGFQLNINRLILATILLFFTILIFQISYSISINQATHLIISGVIGLVLGDSFLFKAFQNIGARLGMLLMASSPVMSAILAFIFLGERLSLIGITGMMVTISGISLVVLEKDKTSKEKYKTNLLGILFGLLGALGQAGGLIFAKLAFNEGEINGFVATFVRISSSAIIILSIGIITRKFNSPIKTYIKDKKALAATIVGTILGPFLGITFSLIAIANTKVGIAAILMSLMPIIMLPIVRYYYKENISWRAITGAFIAVGGVALLFLR